MNDRHQDTDTDLRARFDAQRSADRNEAPPFAAMLARAHAEAEAASSVPRAFNVRRLVYASSLAAAAMIAAVLLVPRTASKEAAFEQAVRAFQKDPALGAWQSPTDGLLNVPGSNLITTVPSVGTQP
jgi:hypothetical protein